MKKISYFFRGAGGGGGGGGGGGDFLTVAVQSGHGDT